MLACYLTLFSFSQFHSVIEWCFLTVVFPERSGPSDSIFSGKLYHSLFCKFKNKV